MHEINTSGDSVDEFEVGNMLFLVDHLRYNIFSFLAPQGALWTALRGSDGNFTNF